MKASDAQKKKQPDSSRSSQPFFGAKSSGAFFSQSRSDSTPFFQPSGSVIQTKLTVGAVGAVGDKYEQEADRVAADVVAKMNDSYSQGMGEQPTVQRIGEEEELQMKPMLQRVGAEGGAVSADFENQLSSARGGGQGLVPNLQAQMGQAMGADFSKVRVHTDARSDQLNRFIQAKAFTTGQDVFFRQGAYQPQSRDGQALVAHELTHVMQQVGSKVSRQMLMPRHSYSNMGESCLQNKTQLSPKALSDDQLIQKWPLPEAHNQTSRKVPNFKCHSAVVYWLILEINGGNKKQATDAIDKLHQVNGATMSWISQALGYDDATPVNSAADCAAGDILYMPNRGLPMHSVVYLGGDNIAGFNNGGTWGKPGDQWTQESIDANNWRLIEDGPYAGRMSLGVSPNNPVYKVTHAHAVASLKSFAPDLALSKLM